MNRVDLRDYIGWNIEYSGYGGSVIKGTIINHNEMCKVRTGYTNLDDYVGICDKSINMKGGVYPLSSIMYFGTIIKLTKPGSLGTDIRKHYSFKTLLEQKGPKQKERKS